MKRNLRIAIHCLKPIRKRGPNSLLRKINKKYLREMTSMIDLMKDKGLFDNNFDEPKIGDVITFDMPPRVHFRLKGKI